jgi:hypothetical protein
MLEPRSASISNHRHHRGIEDNGAEGNKLVGLEEKLLHALSTSWILADVLPSEIAYKSCNLQFCPVCRLGMMTFESLGTAPLFPPSTAGTAISSTPKIHCLARLHTILVLRGRDKGRPAGG